MIRYIFTCDICNTQKNLESFEVKNHFHLARLVIDGTPETALEKQIQFQACKECVGSLEVDLLPGLSSYAKCAPSEKTKSVFLKLWERLKK